MYSFELKWNIGVHFIENGSDAEDITLSSIMLFVIDDFWCYISRTATAL
jgi:hypothetical protein